MGTLNAQNSVLTRPFVAARGVLAALLMKPNVRLGLRMFIVTSGACLLLACGQGEPEVDSSAHATREESCPTQMEDTSTWGSLSFGDLCKRAEKLSLTECIGSNLPMIHAAEDHAVKAGRHLSQCGASEKIYPLHWAASSLKMETVREMVEKMGFDVNEPGKAGATPLMLVAQLNDTLTGTGLLRDGVTTLLDLGANPNLADDRGDTPLLRLALRDVDKEAVRALLAKGADPNAQSKALPGFPEISPETAPRRAAQDATENLKSILGAPTFQPRVLTVASGNGETALMVAVNRLSSERVNLLLAQPNSKDFIDLQDKLGQTALMIAVRVGDSYLENVKSLVQKGADRQLTNKEGKTALAIAKEFAGRDAIHSKIVEYLESLPP